MNKLWILLLLTILVCTPTLASANEYEIVPHTGPERGMYSGGGAEDTISFWELPFKLQLIYISGLLATSVTLYKFLPLLLGRVRQNCKNQNRDEILEFITANPGSTISDIGKQLKLNRGTIKYHLKILHMCNKVKCVRKGKIVMIFKNSCKLSNTEQKIAFFLRNDTGKSILISILHKPGMTNQNLTQTFDLDKSTVHWHINDMHNEGLVYFENDGKYKRCFINPAIEVDLENAISEVEPAILAR
ncbi:winged helix-turn-helix transcriptional regulator [Methanococcoides seepicolus]|uniref:Winged helix-turn-helix transcriptional regulator n=1 Tax=Methanococcoides seepicolus TaxID=2828780 RepID=A0A9E4ZED7_9EURY|nr:winged helix-turn-helix transcriptional regulator [Methanococcoides seepicolus]MCM1986343.1 winged helix-turn-helix transcriptional regulator [Methanococcoides seepicolus]